MTFVADTEPYAWPYDGRLAGDHLALVLAGWDESWAERSVDVAGTALANVVTLAGAAAAAGWPSVRERKSAATAAAMRGNMRISCVDGRWDAGQYGLG